MTIQKSNRLSANKGSIKKRMTLTFIVSVCLLFIFAYLDLAIGTSDIQSKDIYLSILLHLKNQLTKT